MSPKSAKHPTTSDKHAVPIVNVFDEDNPDAPVQPARRPVVVEIENVPPLPAYQDIGTAEQMSAPAAFPAAVSTPAYQPMTPPSVPASSTGVPLVSPAPHPEYPSAAQPETAPVTPPVATQPVPAPPTQIPMSKEPILPSFFAQDLQANPPGGLPAANAAPSSAAPTVQAGVNPASVLETAVPQAVVGEINEISEEGGGNKKMIGIILMVIAVIILIVAGIFLYSRSLFSPIALPSPSPTPVTTPRPTLPPSPTPSASDSATLASQSAALKKKVKIDVLNGTKTAGLAAKQATRLKEAGFLTGTVGNGKPENAGTITVAPMYRVLADEIVSILKDLTFTIEENSTLTTIQVTIGE